MPGENDGDNNSGSSDEPPTFISPKTPDPNSKDESGDQRRESLWMSMGIHRSTDSGTLRKRRMSQKVESIEASEKNLANLGKV